MKDLNTSYIGYEGIDVSISQSLLYYGMIWKANKDGVSYDFVIESPRFPGQFCEVNILTEDMTFEYYDWMVKDDMLDTIEVLAEERTPMFIYDVVSYYGAYEVFSDTLLSGGVVIDADELGLEELDDGMFTVTVERRHQETSWYLIRSTHLPDGNHSFEVAIMKHGQEKPEVWIPAGNNIEVLSEAVRDLEEEEFDAWEALLQVRKEAVQCFERLAKHNAITPVSVL